jgi:prepilin-type N-terminal cleavage/methylation domain-containing protein
MRKQKRLAQAGFSMIEMMVATGLMVIIGASIAGLQYIMAKNEVLVLTGSLNVDQANASLAAISRELRTARAGDQGAYLIESASAQALVFYSDIDADGKSERIHYFLQGTNLQKGTTEPSGNPVTYPSNTEKVRTITENIRNGAIPIFNFLNENGQTTSNVSLIRMIQIYLRVNQNAGDPESDYVLETNANVRTLKENL